MIISVGPAGMPDDCPTWQKLERSDSLGHYRCDECQTLRDGTTR